MPDHPRSDPTRNGRLTLSYPGGGCTWGTTGNIGTWKLRLNFEDILDMPAFTVEKANTTATTEIHTGSSHTVLPTPFTLPVGTAVHDKILVSGKITGFPLTGNVDFKLYAGTTCSGTQVGSTQTVAIIDGSPGYAESSAVTLPVGAYSYLAEYKGGDNYNGDTADCEPFYVVGSAVTSSSLCTFDVSDVSGDQFRLIFTPDGANGWWKLSASNPGQFYFNVFTAGNGPVDITIPAPFVTQGANPVHVYGSVGTATNGQTCYTPGTEQTGFSVSGVPITYSPGGGSIIVSNLGSGFHYIAVHLDYGKKGTTGYTPDQKIDHPNALNSTSGPINNGLTYTFLATGVPNSVVSNENVFKNDPGIGGLVLKAGTGEPVAGTPVEIWLNGKKVATVATDADGWYMWAYKYTGKAATFTVKPTAFPGVEKSVTLKSNGYLVVNFSV